MSTARANIQSKRCNSKRRKTWCCRFFSVAAVAGGLGYVASVVNQARTFISPFTNGATSWVLGFLAHNLTLPEFHAKARTKLFPKMLFPVDALPDPLPIPMWAAQQGIGDGVIERIRGVPGEADYYTTLILWEQGILLLITLTSACGLLYLCHRNKSQGDQIKQLQEEMKGFIERNKGQGQSTLRKRNHHQRSISEPDIRKASQQREQYHQTEQPDQQRLQGAPRSASSPRSQLSHFQSSSDAGLPDSKQPLLTPAERLQIKVQGAR